MHLPLFYKFKELSSTLQPLLRRHWVAIGRRSENKNPNTSDCTIALQGYVVVGEGWVAVDYEEPQ